MCTCSKCLNDITFAQGEKGDTGATGAPGTNGTNGTNGTGTLTPVVEMITATVALTAADTGKMIYFNRPAGIVVTLPDTPPDGTNFTFEVIQPLTVLPYTINTTAGDTIEGAVFMAKAGAVSTLFAAVPPITQISMNGSTSGGLVGTSFKMVFDGVDTWRTSGTIYGSGATITPFS